MTYIKLPQPHKTLFLTLAVIGATNTFLSGGDLQAYSQFPLPEVSTTTPTDQNSAEGKAFRRFSTDTQHARSAATLTALTTREPTLQIAQTPPLPTPPDNGAPGQREGAASRGRCRRVNHRLTALVPIVQQISSKDRDSSTAMTTSGVVWGLTTTSHPSFWFYVPYAVTPGSTIEFVLQDETGKDIYQTALTSSEADPGVMGFQLPPTAPSLEIGKRYHWFFTVNCNQAEPVLVEGWIGRAALNPSLKRQLQQATPQQSIALYRRSGIWQEAVTTLAQLRRQYPDDAKLKAEWTNLLQSIGLEAIAPEPVTSMLTPKA